MSEDEQTQYDVAHKCNDKGGAKYLLSLKRPRLWDPTQWLGPECGCLSGWDQRMGETWHARGMPTIRPSQAEMSGFSVRGRIPYGIPGWSQVRFAVAHSTPGSVVRYNNV